MANIPPKNFLLKVLSVLICVHLWFHVSGFPLKQAVLLAGRFDPEMLISKSGSDAAALCAVEQAELHQVRLVDFLDGVFFFAEGSRNCIEPDRPAGIFLQDGEHQVAVHFVEAMRSEEHTSELQSHSDLVCRLLLEK